MTRWEGERESLSLFHNCMNFKYTVIRPSSAFTAGNETIIIIIELQGWLTVKSQAASSPLFTHAGQMAKEPRNTLGLCVFSKHITNPLFHFCIKKKHSEDFKLSLAYVKLLFELGYSK